jgi:hypothetical protein
VEVDTPLGPGWGWLVGDARTVAVPAVWPYLRPPWAGAEGSEATPPRLSGGTLRYSGEALNVLVVRLAEPAGGTILPVSAEKPAPGGVVVARLKDARELSVLVQVSGPGWFRVALGAGEAGAAILDGQGACLGLLGDDGTVEALGEVLRKADEAVSPSPRAVIDLAIEDVHLACKLGGQFAPPTDHGFAAYVEFGATLWDRLTLPLLIGGYIPDPKAQRLPDAEAWGVPLGDFEVTTFELGFEPRVKIPLHELPVNLDLVIGVRYGYKHLTVEANYLRGTDPDCDPQAGPCPFEALRDVAELHQHSVGTVFGIDLHIDLFLLSWRYLPKAMGYQQTETMQFLVGASLP